MPEPEELRKGDRVSKNWRTINSVLRELRQLGQEVRRLRDGHGRVDDLTRRHPLKVYLVPNFQRPLDDRTEHAWRICRVHTGYIIDPTPVLVEGCDIDEIVVPLPVLPATETVYYVWVDLDTSGLGHGAALPGGNYRVLAKITIGANPPARIIQYQHDNIFPSNAAESDARWS